MFVMYLFMFVRVLVYVCNVLVYVCACTCLCLCMYLFMSTLVLVSRLPMIPVRPTSCPGSPRWGSQPYQDQRYVYERVHFRCVFVVQNLPCCMYSEYSLIRHNSFSKNMVEEQVWWSNWMFIGTCTLYWYWEIVVD